jgi:hypothetical protein
LIQGKDGNNKDVGGRAFPFLAFALTSCLCRARFGFAGWEIYDLCLF